MTSPSITASSAMANGTRLGEFEITGVVGEGGFGIVYSAHDSSLDRVVAVKEYLPAAFAGRNQDGTVQVRSEDHKKTFAAGLASFINEARLLAKFSHPSLIEVFRFWEANGTAYMAMRYYRGVTLRDTLRANPQAATEQWLCETLDPILLALNELHREECFHRDIAPDNILVLPNGRSVLMDFGAARRIIGGMTRALTTVLKPGYAPIEQYSDDGSMKQGAWTDIYAMGGLLYHAMTGKVPVQAISRMMNDPLKPVASLARMPYSENLCNVVMKSLAVVPEKRYQTIDELRDALGWITTPVSSTVMIERNGGVPNRPVEVDDMMTVVVPRASPKPAGGAQHPALAGLSAGLDPLLQMGSMTGSTSNSDLTVIVGGKSAMRGASKQALAPESVRNAPPQMLIGESDASSRNVAQPDVPPKKGKSALVAVGLACAVLAVGFGYLFLTKKQPVGAADAMSANASRPAEPKIESPAQSVLPSPPAPTFGLTDPSTSPAAKDPSQPVANSEPVTRPDLINAFPPADVKTEQPPAAVMGTVSLDIKPWGKIVVDGIPMERPSPPTKRLTLAPGTHTIEIQNPAGASVVRTIEVVPGRNPMIRHSFQ